MKAKDVLHLYLGAKVTGTYNDETGRIGFLTGVTNGGTECEIQFILEDGINVEEEPSFNDSKDVKLILRPLSSMTEEERRELWRQVFENNNYPSGSSLNERGCSFGGSTVLIEKETHYDKKRWVMSQGIQRLGIEWTGHVWADSDLHNWRHSQHEVTLWLLSKGFDIFVLHESGDCLYETDLKK